MPTIRAVGTGDYSKPLKIKCFISVLLGLFLLAKICSQRVIDDNFYVFSIFA